MIRLTTGDVSTLTDATPKQLRLMCEKGVLSPENNGEGHGRWRRYTIVETLAIGYGMIWAGLGYNGAKIVSNLLATIGKLSEEELVAEFEAGNTHTMPRIDGPMDLTPWGAEPEYGEPFNLKSLYDDLKKHLAETAKEHRAKMAKTDKRGRRTGLAGG